MTNKYDITKNEQPMPHLYVVVSRDDDGNEGIVSAITPMGGMPLVFGYERNIEQVRDLLVQMSRDSGKKLYIVKYKEKEVIETIDASH